MSVQVLARAAADTLGATAGHAAATPYDLAFLSSTAVEIITVATVLTMVALSLARSIFRSGGMGDYWLRLYRAFDILKLSKMIIPLACLSATVWVWSLIQGA
jgi:hypothetical protein